MRKLILFLVAVAAGSLVLCSVQGATPLGKIVYSGGGDIWLYDLATGADTQLTFTRSGEANPKFSPDGQTIAFQGAGIFLMNPDGSNVRLLSSFGATPAWSHDGTKIAFADSSRTTRKGIWVINVDGTGLQHLSNAGAFPAWSPDGFEIAFRNGDNPPLLSVMDSDGSNPHAISSQKGVIDIVWSPSNRLALARTVDPKSSFEVLSCDPLNCDGSLRQLTNRPKQDYEPTWSPDASMIAWAALGTPAGIYIMNADGSGQTLKISGGRQPSWGP